MTKMNLNDKMNNVAEQLKSIANQYNEHVESFDAAGHYLAIASDFDKLTEQLSSIVSAIREVESTSIRIYFEDVLEHAAETKNSDSVLQEIADFTNNLYNKPKYFVENSMIIKK